MSDAFSCWSVLVLVLLQILVGITSAHPVTFRNDATDEVKKRFKRSPLAECEKKKQLKDRDGIIVVKPEYRLHARSMSCSWIIHVPRGTLAQLEFSTFNIEDSCPGTCQCNYLAIKENIGSSRSILKKYCNERKPPRDLLSGGDKIRIHLRVKSGSQTSLELRYSTMLREKSTKFAQQRSDEDMITHVIKDNAQRPGNHGNDASNIRVRKVVPSARVTDVTVTAQPTQDPGPSKLTILLAVAIPVVLIFMLVVLLIAYYNYYTDQKQKESGEDIPKSGATLSDLIMNTSTVLTPMFNLGKARRESTQRKEKANKLYDDMLQNWRLMNDDKKKREQAREESVNTWESYKKHKQRRNTRDSVDNSNQAFAMLVTNAINVASNPVLTQEKEESEKPDMKEAIEEIEEKPRTNSILIKRSSDSIRNSRGSKVLSWSDISTTKPAQEKVTSQKRTKSETELKTLPRGSGGSAHIPAIVVSQPSIETEDDEPEANDTDRLIKDEKDSPTKTPDEPSGTKSASTTYSCSEHVKDILRESYGEEMEEWFQKPKKTSSQGSLHHVPDSSVKYQAMKSSEEDDDID